MAHIKFYQIKENFSIITKLVIKQIISSQKLRPHWTNLAPDA